MKDWLAQEFQASERRLVAELHKLTSPNLRENSHAAVMRMLKLESAAMHVPERHPGSKI